MNDEQIIMKGLPAAEAITEDLRKRADSLKGTGIAPTLAILRVGEDLSALSYERGAAKRAEKTGVAIRNIVLREDAGEEEVLGAIKDINADTDIHGCLMFRPLKDKETERRTAELLDAKKDVDCMTRASQAAVYMGENAGFAPCTAQAVSELLGFYKISVAGKKVAVVGRSLVIGRPAAMLLLKENATVTICHSGTENLRDIVKNSDIVVAAVGHAGMLDESYLRKGQVIIDVGINIGDDGKLCGDVRESAKETLAAAYTPVPGGVGSMTSTILMKHVIEAAERTVGR